MVDPLTYPFSYNTGWAEAWADNYFKAKILAGAFVFISILLYLPHFFSFIEARQGIVLNDWLLHLLPAKNFSVIIFLFVWSTSILVIIRCVQQPAMFLIALYLLIIITLSRIGTISFFPLDAPAGLIPLTDPLTSLTYGGTQVFITKDLFFSGHTSNLFMFTLCLQQRRDKQFALLATIIVGSLVLVQHVHYSIDVVVAFIFTWYLVKWAKRLHFFKIKTRQPITKQIITGKLNC